MLGEGLGGHGSPVRSAHHGDMALDVRRLVLPVVRGRHHHPQRLFVEPFQLQDLTAWLVPERYERYGRARLQVQQE